VRFLKNFRSKILKQTTTTTTPLQITSLSHGGWRVAKATSNMCHMSKIHTFPKLFQERAWELHANLFSRLLLETDDHKRSTFQLYRPTGLLHVCYHSTQLSPLPLLKLNKNEPTNLPGLRLHFIKETAVILFGIVTFMGKFTNELNWQNALGIVQFGDFSIDLMLILLSSIAIKSLINYHSIHSRLLFVVNSKSLDQWTWVVTTLIVSRNICFVFVSLCGVYIDSKFKDTTIILSGIVTFMGQVTNEFNWRNALSIV
jgi:hypothetical protein